MSEIFSCNKCGKPLIVSAIVGDSVPIPADKKYYPFAVNLGCSDCGIVVNSRLLVVADEADEGVR